MIRRHFQEMITAYFREHPERIEAPDTAANLKAMLLLMQNILAAVDGFDVTDRPDERGR